MVIGFSFAELDPSIVHATDNLKLYSIAESYAAPITTAESTRWVTGTEMEERLERLGSLPR